MLSRLAVWLALAAVAFGATSRLYLKNGEYHLVREYQVLEDRVRYYSTERGDWEELPLELVDLDRTKKEAADRKSAIEEEDKAQAAEDSAIHAAKQQVTQIPEEPGVYYINGDKLVTVKPSEIEIVTDKTRAVLKVLSPVPMVPGKATVETKGETAPFRVTGNEPEFFFRLADYHRFGIIKLTRKKNYRVVETVAILPGTNEKLEQQKQIDTFKKQEGEVLYKIWPEKPLEPGEYALIEYVDGEVSLQIWDFGVGPVK
jgi:hypothetical protein